MTNTYRISVKGHLPDRWRDSFGRLEMDRLPDGTTALTGPVVDQAELHGILARIRDLGIPLLSVTPAGEKTGDEGRGNQGGDTSEQ